MSFVTQEDVFAAIEPVMRGVFEEFADERARSTPRRSPRIPYEQAMLDYGTDKPDLRNPLRIRDVTAHFAGSGFGLFAQHRGVGRRGARDPGAGCGGASRAASSTS